MGVNLTKAGGNLTKAGVSYMKIGEVAKRLAFSRRTVYNFIRRGELDAVKIPPYGGDLRVSTAELQRFVKWCQESSTKNGMIKCPNCGWRF